MAEHSTIEWTDATWNPITGCSVISPGCKRCYAMKLAGSRLQSHPSRAGLTVKTKEGAVWTGEVRFNEGWLSDPVGWRKPRRVFVCAHGDLFHENVPDAWIDRVVAIMVVAPQHTYQVLTKRSARMREYWQGWAELTSEEREARLFDTGVFEWLNGQVLAWPPENIWLGVSAEDQARFDERWADLAATPAAVRFLSLEPLLGEIDITEALWNFQPCDSCPCPDPALSRAGYEECCREPDQVTLLHWVIVGGESGPRPMHPDWVRKIRNACDAADVDFFFKQWGTHAWAERVEGDPSTLTPYRAGKKLAGRLLDGVEHNAMPAPR